MGSPSSRLKTPEQFRPWVESGLQYVYQPGGAQQAASADSTPGQKPIPQQPQAPQQQTSSQPSHHSVPERQAAPEPPQQPSVSAQTDPQPVQPSPAPRPVFPEPWASFLNLVTARNPMVVCTYMELGLDMGGQSDPKRRAVLRNTLNHHLKWPKGTAAFWPMSALVQGSLQPNSPMFWKGWEIWRSPYIACFGEEAARIIYPQAQPGVNTYHLEHVAIYVLPPLSTLITMLPHEQQLSIELLLKIRI